MGESPWALWVALGALVVGVALYVLGLVGRGLGDSQMVTLRVFLDDTLDRLVARGIEKSSPRATDAARGSSLGDEAERQVG
jgi:hypothetical protein